MADLKPSWTASVFICWFLFYNHIVHENVNLFAFVVKKSVSVFDDIFCLRKTYARSILQRKHINSNFPWFQASCKAKRLSWGDDIRRRSFVIASAVLLVTFGKLITHSWFSYLMVAIIQFEVVMLCLGLRRPLGAENNGQILLDSDVEFSRNDSPVDRSLSKRKKDHSKWLQMNSMRSCVRYSNYIQTFLYLNFEC